MNLFLTALSKKKFVVLRPGLSFLDRGQSYKHRGYILARMIVRSILGKPQKCVYKSKNSVHRSFNPVDRASFCVYQTAVSFISVK